MHQFIICSVLGDFVDVAQLDALEFGAVVATSAE